MDMTKSMEMIWAMIWAMTCRVVMEAAGDRLHFREHLGADMAEAMDDHPLQEHQGDLVLAEAMGDLRHPEHQGAPEQAEAMDDLPLQEHQGAPVAATDGLLNQELQVVPASAEQMHHKNDSKIMLLQAIFNHCDELVQPNQESNRIAHR